MDPFLPDDQKVATIRALLPATGAGIHLDVPTAGPLPAETDRALREADDWDLRVGRGGPDHALDAALRREEARGVIAAVLGVSPDRVVVTAGVRAATVGVLAAIEPRAPVLATADGLDPEILAGARAIAQARGWALAGTDPPSGAVLLAPAVRADGEAAADLGDLGRHVHATGGSLLVDMTLASGSTDLGLQSMGADAAILATDRWLLGPGGTAAAWFAPGLGGEALVRAEHVVDPLPRRAALGLGRSVGWLLMYVGLPWAVSRTGEMGRRLRVALAAIPGVALRGSATTTDPVIAFTIEGWHVHETEDELGRRVFAITGRTPDGAANRVGVAAWNTETELDRFAATVALLAAHTPDTLPRREPLLVLGDG